MSDESEAEKAVVWVWRKYWKGEISKTEMLYRMGNLAKLWKEMV